MKLRILPLMVMLLLASAAFVCLPGGAARGTAQRRRVARPRASQTRARSPRVDYSDFSHRTPQHRRRSCDSCHQSPTANWASVRAKETAFPDVTDYPAHASCLDCHRRQFYSGARPVICSVCHTVVSPRASGRHPFQNPSETFARSTKSTKKQRGAPSDFVVNFPHDRHQDVMARAVPAGRVGFVRAAYARQEEAKEVDSCSLCHQTFRPQGDSQDEYLTAPPKELAENDLRVPAFWMKKGMLKTTPASHASCFNCHWQDGGERPLSSDCAGCHTPAPAAAPPARKAADADTAHPSARSLGDAAALEHWAGRRVARFKHEQGNHESVGCTACHVTITSVSRLGPDTLDVPIQTCASSNCHGATRPPKNIIFREVEQRRKPEGASYQCAKCHLGYGREPTPKSHADLFPAK
jgi:hypothetical protein